MEAIIQAMLDAGIIDAEVAGIMQRQQNIDTARAWAETLLTNAVQGSLSAQQQRILALLQDDDGRLPSGAFWATEDELMYEALTPAIAQIVTERATFAAIVNEGTFNYSNGDAQRWAQTYYQSGNIGAVPNLNQTSREQFAGVFDQWLNGDLGRRGLPDLIDSLVPIFGPTRASNIGVTETTRIFVEAQRAAEANNDFTVGFTWNTAADDRVCPICGPLNGQTRQKRGGYPGGVDIPAHPRCRCHESPETLGTLGLLPGQVPPMAIPPEPTPQDTAQVTPAATVTRLGPNGTPVGAVLTPTRGHAITNQHIRPTISIIDSVHGDGVLPNIPITAESMTNRNGYFQFSIDGTPRKIGIGTVGDSPRLTTAHEIGHFIEMGGIFPALNTNSNAVNALSAFQDIVNGTSAISRLNGFIDGSQTITITLVNGLTMQSGADINYTRYLLTNDEIWARAYSQYIAVKSKDATMLKELDIRRDSYYPVQWDDDDFSPVINAIDDLFVALGWMQ